METTVESLFKWESDYHPITNPFNDFGWNNTLFETHGEDFEFVKQQPSAHVWTWVDTDEGSYIINGLHIVNRIGYFVTERPWESDIDVEVTNYEEEWNES